MEKEKKKRKEKTRMTKVGDKRERSRDRVTHGKKDLPDVIA